MTLINALLLTVLLVVALLASDAEAQAPPSGPSTAPSTQPLKVFVCAGQSNMVGKRSRAADLPEDLRKAHDGVLVFDGQAWAALDPTKSTTGFGPEVAFAIEMHKALGQPVGIIKHAVGGSGMDKWSPAEDGGLYKQLAEMVATARKSRDIEIAGMIWAQGGRDARDETAAGKYAVNLKSLIDTARKDFGAAKMPVIALRINNGAGRVASDVVRKAIETCDALQYAWIDGDDLDKFSDQIHLSTKGHVECGRRYAAVMLKLLGR